MIEEMMKGIIENTINKEYSHLRIPNSVYVQITKATKEGFKWDYPIKIDNITLSTDCPYHSSITGSGSATISQALYTYNLKILKEDKSINESYPEVPDIKSFVKLNVGDVAVAVLQYGKVNPFIVGKVG